MYLMTLLKKETLVFFVSCFTYLGLEVKHKVKELGYMYKDIIDLVVLVGTWIMWRKHQKHSIAPICGQCHNHAYASAENFEEHINKSCGKPLHRFRTKIGK